MERAKRRSRASFFAGRTFLRVLVLPALALVLGRAAWAAWQAAGQSVNLFSVAPFRVEVAEDYVNPGGVFPSQEVKKQVHVKNTGRAAALVRARVEVAFGHLDEEGAFVREDLDPKAVRIRFDETGLWQEREDGYFYYAEVLEGGEQTRVPLMESFVLSPDLPPAYRDKEGRIFVHMESVQAEGEARQSWGVSEEGFSWDYERALWENEPVLASFQGVREGFAFEGSEEDIFASFRFLTPGCARLQRIEVSNDSLLSCEMQLCAGRLLPGDEQEGEEEELRELLHRYVMISLRDEKGELYRGPADGNPDAGEGEDTMFRPISLGSFFPGQKKHYILTAAVSPEMEEVYRPLLAKVRWEFLASGGEYPYTGDSTPLAKYILMAGAALAVLILGVKGRKKNED